MPPETPWKNLWLTNFIQDARRIYQPSLNANLHPSIMKTSVFKDMQKTRTKKYLEDLVSHSAEFGSIGFVKHTFCKTNTNESYHTDIWKTKRSARVRIRWHEHQHVILSSILDLILSSLILSMGRCKFTWREEKTARPKKAIKIFLKRAQTRSRDENNKYRTQRHNRIVILVEECWFVMKYDSNTKEI